MRAGMEEDPFIIVETPNQEFAEDLMRERHWVSEPRGALRHHRRFAHG
jgi:hypothetical protein